VAVKGILAVWKAAPFAGGRRNEGLGRSVLRVAVPLLHASAPMTADVRRDAEEGNAVGMRAQSACTRRRHERSLQANRGRVLRSVLRPVHVDPHYAPQTKVSEVGRSNRHHGWANPRKWEETNTGVDTGERSAARRGSPLPQGRGRDSSEQEGGQGLRPCEDPRESGFGCSHVVMQLQKSVGDVWPRISSANALQKERSGSSERGPSSERALAGETVGGRVERRAQSQFGLTAMTGEDRHKTQGDERSSLSGRNVAKSGGAVAGPGL
jgi:hypothetical protein